MTEAQPTQSQPSVPLRVIVISAVAIWSVYFALVTVRGLVVGMDFDFDLLWRRGTVCLTGIFATIVLWLIMRLFEAKARWIMMAVALVVAMPGAVLVAQVNQMLFMPIVERMEKEFAEEAGFTIRRDESGNLLAEIEQPRDWVQDESAQGDPDNPRVLTFKLQDGKDKAGKWAALIDAALSRYYILLTWAALYIAMLAIAQTRAAERREQQFRSVAKAAEIRSLRYQVNPHFLFNTLNSLSALVMTGKGDRAERMIQTISRFYRHSLADEPTVDVRLRDEFDLQRLYLDIEAVRFPDRLTCLFDLPEDLADARVPGMILQPLVENSVKYAVSRVNREITIKVVAREEFDRLVVTVSDDGPGVPEGAPHGFGIGLANVRDRLEARFGPDIGFSSAPIEGGYSTEMRIPLTRHG
ncbi:MAG: histidine kinase [Pseudomonadota bacterium]